MVSTKMQFQFQHPLFCLSLKKFNTHIPLGAQFCFIKHLKLEAKEKSNKTISSPKAQANAPKESMPSDEIFVPKDISIPEDVLDTVSVVSRTNLTCTLDTSPIQYQIKRKSVRLGRSNKTKTEKKIWMSTVTTKKKMSRSRCSGAIWRIYQWHS